VWIEPLVPAGTGPSGRTDGVGFRDLCPGASGAAPPSIGGMAIEQLARRPSVPEVESALALAVRAPSIHNTQPWRWEYGPDGLDLYADRSRGLSVIDPDGRGLLVSCGAALYLARLALAGQGWPAEVRLRPDPARPDLLARIVPADQRQPVDERTPALVAAARRRRTERRPFRPDPVPVELLDVLCRIGEGAGCYPHLVRRAEERLDLAVVMSWADRLEAQDPAYRTELARWVRPDAITARDGVPPTAVPHVPAGEQRHAAVPLRDFELGRAGSQQLPAGVDDEQPAWIVLFTATDDAPARLQAGQAYAHLSVEAERLGLASSAATQAVDLPGVRERVRALLDWPDHPQMMLRIGWPPAGEPAPATPRHPVAAVLTVLDPAG